MLILSLIEQINENDDDEQRGHERAEREFKKVIC